MNRSEESSLLGTAPVPSISRYANARALVIDLRRLCYLQLDLTRITAQLSESGLQNLYTFCHGFESVEFLLLNSGNTVTISKSAFNCLMII